MMTRMKKRASERPWVALMGAAATLGLAVLPAACNKASDEPATETPVTDAPPSQTEEQSVEYVLLDTSMGEILLELDREKAPLTVKSFLQYTKDGFYDGTIFHRVIPGFMVQGGGMTADMQPKRTSGNVRNESTNGLLNERGTVAMARTSDPHSASSQFFINVVDNDGLNRDQAADGWGYAVFGKVIAGMNTVDQIVAVPTTRVGQHADVPREPITLESATPLSKQEADAKKSEIGE